MRSFVRPAYSRIDGLTDWLTCLASEQATVFVRSEDDSAAAMRQVQDALGIAADSQQLIFASNVLRPTDTMASKRIGDGCTLQASCKQ